MIEERCETYPTEWKALTLAGALLSDWGDFEYYQQLAGDTGTDRMEAFQIAPERFKSIPGRHSKIFQFSSVMQIKKLPPGDAAQFLRKGSRRSAASIIEKILCQPIPERFDHVLMLS